jgi:hypothetical protein
MKPRSLLFVGSLLLFTLTARAQGRFDISPFYGYRWGGGIETTSGQEISFQDGRAYGLALDYSPLQSTDFKLELLWSRQDSSIDLHGFRGENSLRMTVDEFQIGALVEKPSGKFHPYLSALVGASLFGPEGTDSEARFSLSIAGGVKFFLLKNLALRADLRGYCTVVDSDSAFISVGGVTVAHFHGSTLWQGEISGGVTLSF